jgi:hypothetical protein
MKLLDTIVMNQPVTILEQASELTRREIIKRPFDKHPCISWRTDTHDMKIMVTGEPGRPLLVWGDPHPSRICGRGRARLIWVLRPSARYLRTLRPKII